jgi:hypothetical protein
MTETRKEIIRKYKERKPDQGAFAIRCTATGRIWVGASRNLYATQNGAWFALRHGGYHEKSLQAEWNAQGEPAFQYEVLERLDEDVSAMAVIDLLKEKKACWAAELGAQVIW